MLSMDGREGIWSHADQLPYHVAQLESPYRSTEHFGRFLADVLDIDGAEALDVGCGAGQNMLYLSEHVGRFHWTGIDIAGEFLFPVGRPYFERRGVDARFVTGDFYKLTDLFASARFDLVVSLQTLSFVPDFRPLLQQMLSISTRWVAFSSLVTDFEVDAQIAVTDRTRSPGAQGPFYYNVLSLAALKSYCAELGWRRVISRDFEIDIDLPLTSKGLATYTRRLADGTRLQVSGPVLMPWKFVALRRVDD